MLTIYHNPRCSKSRQTLELIKENSQKEIKVIEYLKEPLTEAEIETILSLLSCTPIEMMRVKEAEFKEQNLSKADDKTLIAAMVATPKLIERPIVSDGNKAVIGRPPQNALALC
ncbi:arsenate reductase (glutaredoxin) [Colwellia sp. 4_MG-2023]|jgi:arsenate reductase|uniref:arsenate reductase (glutaredoxin) n=1 Tax=unclassified Colwellia TaxID=196834 RepID=UPI001C0A3DAA|nr:MULTISPECIES: arsenate reductase (glutaredoxin) [unclassified Colwellia]MBU2924685.1 arsenate reductase (glutaredoxin) [Colwellia sp. C2M11]MDO6488441.1 arsenate reductase (glutaredoxin) [Colwellia sp. 6_MG-2023]MDO6507011.1 arsenate reductase (glutaredoxin) [Colwellia sp. 5_MG-2023]MDO6555943.1 arsenate reductase (glutaredoxin) [Colwellia sp. 4_MG-2023]MDO6653521.1 arsenate reductase (glutaredoxin) [Colwellia sp. 3_MG-2023]